MFWNLLFGFSLELMQTCQIVVRVRISESLLIYFSFWAPESHYVHRLFNRSTECTSHRLAFKNIFSCESNLCELISFILQLFLKSMIFEFSEMLLGSQRWTHLLMHLAYQHRVHWHEVNLNPSLELCHQDLRCLHRWYIHQKLRCCSSLRFRYRLGVASGGQLFSPTCYAD